METEKTITVAESITIPERQAVQESPEEKLFNDAFLKKRLFVSKNHSHIQVIPINCATCGMCYGK